MTAKKSSPGERLVDFFNQLNFDTIDELDSFYAENVHFRDPIKEFDNRADLKDYLAKQYKNTISCRFEAQQILTEGRKSSVLWTMHLRHKLLNLGNEIRLEGVTLVEENARGAVVEHRDYFDVSAFLLKSVPGVDAIKNFFLKK